MNMTSQPIKQRMLMIGIRKDLSLGLHPHSLPLIQSTPPKGPAKRVVSNMPPRKNCRKVSAVVLTTTSKALRRLKNGSITWISSEKTKGINQIQTNSKAGMDQRMASLSLFCQRQSGSRQTRAKSMQGVSRVKQYAMYGWVINMMAKLTAKRRPVFPSFNRLQREPT